MTFIETATALANAFEMRTRDNGDEFKCLKRDAPEWMRDMVMEAHGTDMFPDDWRHEIIERAAYELAEGEMDPDDYSASVDAMVDVYTFELTAWVASSGLRVSYVDEAAEMFGRAKTLAEMLMAGQFMEAEEIVGRLIEALREHAEEDEE